MNLFKITTALLGLLTTGCAPSLLADDRDKETLLTVNQPLQVRDTILAPGQYVFRLIGPGVISILNADGTRPEGIIMGWSAYRADAGDTKVFTVSQPQGSQPAALKYWFYPGENSGLEFSARRLRNETGRVLKSKKDGQTTDGAEGASSAP